MSNGSAVVHAKEETSDGVNIRGRYSVRMPDGRLQVVTYSTGSDGYEAQVDYQDDLIGSQPPLVRDRGSNKNAAPKSLPPSDLDELKRDHELEETEQSSSVPPSKVENLINQSTSD